MKSIYIHCPLLTDADYLAVLTRLCPESVRNITVYVYAEQVEPGQIKALVEVQKQFSEDRSVRFRNILVLSRMPAFHRSLRRVLVKNNFLVHLQVTAGEAPQAAKTVAKLTKHGIHSKLWVDAPEDQKRIYDTFAALGLPVNLQRPRYTEDTPRWFDQWLHDPNAQGINTFCDIITMLTMDTYSPNCRYASCFGTTFRVDADLQVYLCPHHMDRRTHLGKLTDLEQLLQCETVAQLLTEAIEKREHCAANCRCFASCQGGCLLEEVRDSECAHYIATVDRIRAALLDVYRSNDLGQVNNVVKNAILNALAFGTAFFN